MKKISLFIVLLAATLVSASAQADIPSPACPPDCGIHN